MIYGVVRTLEATIELSVRGSAAACFHQEVRYDKA